jgi:acetate kinase
VPESWHEAGIRRWGFHGASHKFIAERSAELLGRPDVAERVRRLYVGGLGPTGAPRALIDDPPEESESSSAAGRANGGGAPFAVRKEDSRSSGGLRVISCHLGGSSSITGVRNGVAIGNSLGMSPQSGLPQNNRVGDLDSAALPYAMRTFGLSVDQAERLLTHESGLKGLSGLSNDIRDVQVAAREGHVRARLALDVFVTAARHWIGAYFLALNGADAIVFTAGIGENAVDLRERICANLDQLGIVLDADRNTTVRAREGVISAAESRVKIMVIPTNEELVVAREVRRLLETSETTAGVESTPAVLSTRD